MNTITELSASFAQPNNLNTENCAILQNQLYRVILKLNSFSFKEPPCNLSHLA